MSGVVESHNTDKTPGNALSPVDSQGSIVPPHGLIYQAIRKSELAEKILSGKKLTRRDKQETYFYLTGKNPPSQKRGRPPKKLRDFNIAAEYLDEWAKSKSRNTDKLRKLRENLSEKYGISNRENYRDSTFYQAFKRGRELARFFAAEITRRTEREMISDPQRAISVANDLLKKINNYEIARLQKKGKK